MHTEHPTITCLGFHQDVQWTTSAIFGCRISQSHNYLPNAAFASPRHSVGEKTDGRPRFEGEKAACLLSDGQRRFEGGMAGSQLRFAGVTAAAELHSEASTGAATAKRQLALRCVDAPVGLVVRAVRTGVGAWEGWRQTVAAASESAHVPLLLEKMLLPLPPSQA